MTVRAQSRGNDIEYRGDRWKDCGTGFALTGKETCVLCGKRPGEAGIDACLVPIIDALNAARIPTVASCCGHGRRPGNIMLKDGRELMVFRDYKTSRAADKLFPLPISEKEQRRPR